MTGPGDQTAARPAARGRLRVSHVDRERVIEVLKAAFVQDRLTKDEFDARVGQALASRIYADLTATTADLPAGPATAQPPLEPARAQVQPPGAKGIRSSVRVMSVGTTLAASVCAAILPVSNATTHTHAARMVPTLMTRTLDLMPKAPGGWPCTRAGSRGWTVADPAGRSAVVAVKSA